MRGEGEGVCEVRINGIVIVFETGGLKLCGWVFREKTKEIAVERKAALKGGKGTLSRLGRVCNNKRKKGRRKDITESANILVKNGGKYEGMVLNRRRKIQEKSKKENSSFREKKK